MTIPSYQAWRRAARSNALRRYHDEVADTQRCTSLMRKAFRSLTWKLLLVTYDNQRREIAQAGSLLLSQKAHFRVWRKLYEIRREARRRLLEHTFYAFQVGCQASEFEMEKRKEIAAAQQVRLLRSTLAFWVKGRDVSFFETDCGLRLMEGSV